MIFVQSLWQRPLFLSKMSKTHIVGEPGLVRDLNSKALLATDRRALLAAKAKARQGQQVNDLQGEINKLRNEINELRMMILEMKNGSTTS